MTITPTRYESIESITPNGNPIQIHGRNPFVRRASCDGEMETAEFSFFWILDFHFQFWIFIYVCMFVCLFFFFFSNKSSR